MWTGRSHPPLVLLWCYWPWKAKKLWWAASGAGLETRLANSRAKARSYPRLHHNRPVTLLRCLWQTWLQLGARRAPGPGGCEGFSKGPCTDLTWASLWGSSSEVHPPNPACFPEEPLSNMKCQVNAQRSTCKGKSILWSYEDEEYITKRITEIHMPCGTEESFTKP